MDVNRLKTKAQRLYDLHLGPEILLLPNVWDCPSAVVMEGMGFKALATTSAGIAFSMGFPDGERIGRDAMIEAIGRIASSVDAPVTADLESGYGREPGEAAETVRMAMRAGAAGMNIEDSTKGNPKDMGKPLFDLTLAVDRIHASAEAGKAAGVPLVLNARTDSILRIGKGPDGVKEAISRANAYVQAGARCVFVPGVTDAETIGLLAREINAPLNVLAAAGTPPITELKALGVARVTLGSSLPRIAWSAAAAFMRRLGETGSFDFTAAEFTNQDLNRMMK